MLSPLSYAVGPQPSVLADGDFDGDGRRDLATANFGNNTVSILYGSLGVGIALLVWMYMISLVVLVGAEFNAMLFPRARLGIELIETNAHLKNR